MFYITKKKGTHVYNSHTLALELVNVTAERDRLKNNCEYLGEAVTELTHKLDMSKGVHTEYKRISRKEFELLEAENQKLREELRDKDLEMAAMVDQTCACQRDESNVGFSSFCQAHEEWRDSATAKLREENERYRITTAAMGLDAKGDRGFLAVGQRLIDYSETIENLNMRCGDSDRRADELNNEIADCRVKLAALKDALVDAERLILSINNNRSVQTTFDLVGIDKWLDDRAKARWQKAGAK